MRALAVILVAAVAGTAAAEPSTYAVLIGNNTGAPDETPLHHAENDARKMYEMLVDVGGVPAENAVLLRGAGADTVQRAIIRMNDRIRTEGAAGARLTVYYSGHADGRALHLGGDELPLAVLEQLVRGSPSALRLLLVDACASGALTRVKGGRHASDFPVALEARAPIDGVIFLTASAAEEDAHESDRVAGSFFTHYWVSALFGAADADGDGNVSLAEAYQYTYDNTVRASSAVRGGVQHATFRYELKGRDDVVVSWPRAAVARATLRFPAGRLYYVFAGDGADRPLVAEVAAGDRPAALSLRAGTYFVRGRDRDTLLEGTLRVAAGDDVDASNGLTRVAYAQLARKGGGGVRWAHGPEVGYRLRTPIAPGNGVCQGGFAAWGFELAPVTLALELGLCRESSANDILSTVGWETGLALRAERVFDLPWFFVAAGGSAGGALFSQSYDTPGRAPSRLTAGGVLGAHVTVGRELPGGFALQLRADALLYLVERADLPDASSSFAARFGLSLVKHLNVL